MNPIKIICAAALLGAAVGAPAYAQMESGSMKKDGMMSGDHMKMSMKDKKMMSKCQGMDHGMMMKNKSCMKMMKMHPDMMKGG